VSEYVPEIIVFIETLIQRGYAYGEGGREGGRKGGMEGGKDVSVAFF